MDKTSINESDKSFFQGEGYVVIREVYNEEEVGFINHSYKKAWLELIRTGHIQQSRDSPIGSLFPRMHDYHKKDNDIFSIALDNRLFKIIEQLLGEEALLISNNYFFKPPGSEENPPHQDNYSIGVYPSTTIAALISLDDSDKENGCTYFLRGTQFLELLSPDKKNNKVTEAFSDEGQKVNIEGSEQIEVPTKAGDLIIFDGNIIHGAAENSSKDRFRRTLLNFYSSSSIEKITMNFNNLFDKEGNRVRRRLNSNPKITEGERSVFAFRDGDYYKHNGWK